MRMVCFGFGPRKSVAAVVGFGWLVMVSHGFSRSISNAFSFSTRLASVATSSASSIINENGNNDGPHYKWLIIGGGIHGVSIASRLVGTNCISTDQLLVVDEHPRLLHSWKERTTATGMTFLRSSSGFHLDIPAQGLREFASAYGTSKASTKKKKPSKKAARKAKNHRNKGSNPHGIFVGSDYQRPALELFNDHCDLVVNKYALDDSFFRGRVEAIVSDNSNKAKVVIRNSVDSTSKAATTTVSADNIVLAVGNDDPLYPEWANSLISKNKSSNNSKISHLLQISDVTDDIGNDDRDNTPPTDNPHVVAIIGGGISAVHKALQLTSQDNNKKSQNGSDNVVVHIISRHPVREQQFDTHQDWMMTQELASLSLENGGKGLTDRQTQFKAMEGFADRREVIKRERVPGTVPSYMTRAKGGLEERISQDKIQWHVAEVNSASLEEKDGRYQLYLSSGCNLSVNEIILATGLGKRPPGHSIIHPLAEEANLPLSPCGYPLVDESLEWKQQQQQDAEQLSGKQVRSKIFVSGGLAELELGPSARNIAGARMAAERILQISG